MKKFNLLKVKLRRLVKRIISRLQKGNFEGEWVTDEIKVPIGLNTFGRWTGQYETAGRYIFKVDFSSKDINTCQFYAPIEGNGNKGYFAVYSGKFQLLSRYILIWQNEYTPVRIKYKLIRKRLFQANNYELELSINHKNVIFKKNTDTKIIA